MIKDEESLLRMNFLIQAARLYQDSFPEFSSHFIYDFIQLSEKKIIRMYPYFYEATNDSKKRSTKKRLLSKKKQNI